MKNKAILLDCGDDVILFEKDTFKVSRLRELVIRQIVNKWRHNILPEKTLITDSSVGSLFRNMSAGEESILFSEIKISAVKDCQLLKIGEKSWQEGKLEIHISIYPNSKKENKMLLEFYPNEFIEA